MRVEIPKISELEDKVFAVHNEKEYAAIALEVFHFQFAYNQLYRDYCLTIGRTPEQVTDAVHIPFMPISFFKTHRIETTSFDPALVFKSSGTTGNLASTHYVKDHRIYEKSFMLGFERFYGQVADYCILGLLPSYLERGQSSLVYMVDHLIRKSGHPNSGFYLHDFDSLNRTLKSLEAAGQRTLLIGVTHALLDFCTLYPQQLAHTIIMETGGMKGRGKEMVRAELYDCLKSRFGVQQVHSEYGMTELLSQSYAIDGEFRTVPWMRIRLRDETDPLTILESRASTGGINVADLANLYSISFIATEDMGRTLENGNFEVLGRLDHSEVRGCSLMSL